MAMRTHHGAQTKLTRHKTHTNTPPLSPYCSAQKQERAAAALTAGVVAGVASMAANPLVAEAAVTPSLKNFLYSLVAGGAVLAAIAGAITAVSNFDPVKRG
jgi:uncharacterized membrane protein